MSDADWRNMTCGFSLNGPAGTKPIGSRPLAPLREAWQGSAREQVGANRTEVAGPGILAGLFEPCADPEVDPHLEVIALPGMEFLRRAQHGEHRGYVAAACRDIRQHHVAVQALHGKLRWPRGRHHAQALP